MTNFDNRLTVDTIPLLIKGLKDIEADFETNFAKNKDGFKGSSLILTGKDKFFSNGFDLSTVTKNNVTFDDFFSNYFNQLALLLLNFKLPTIAAINGHAYAAGLMLALCLDFRIMREDRGYICMPEIDLSISLSPGMMSIVQSGFTSKKSCSEFILSGQKLNASQALQLELISGKAPEDKVLDEAYKMAKELATKVSKDNLVYRNLRLELKNETVKSLESGGLGFLKGVKSL